MTIEEYQNLEVPLIDKNVYYLEYKTYIGTIKKYKRNLFLKRDKGILYIRSARYILNKISQKDAEYLKSLDVTVTEDNYLKFELC